MTWFNAFLRNPVTLWLSWLLSKASIEFRNRGKSICVGYLAQARGVEFGYGCRLGNHAMATKVTMGDFSYAGDSTRMINVEIGKFVSIASDVLVGLGNHPSRSFVSTHPVFYLESGIGAVPDLAKNSFTEFSRVVVGSDVWIGTRAIIKDGVVIGDGAIVAAGSVVTKNVAPYSVVGGVPARVIRMRFSEEQIAFLQELRWWDNDIEWLKKNAEKFGDIGELMSKHARGVN